MSIIEKRIYLEPKYLNSNISQHLYEKLEQITLNECTKDYGYILSIIRIIEIIGNEDTIFTIKFEAETLKPEKGKIFDSIVCMIYKDGIFVNICDKQKMLIPSLTLKDYKLNIEENIYENLSGKENIKVGSKISVKITAVKYNSKNFSCVGCFA